MRIPVHSAGIRRREMDAVLTCMVEEKIGPGEANQKLIRYIREYYGAEGVVALRSPAAALVYALQAFNFPLGSGVLLSALAPAWQYVQLRRYGFVPVIADVDPSTGLISMASVEEGIRSGAVALILHETLGNMPDMSTFSELPIPVIEDISQSAGAMYDEKRAGCFGAFTILGLEEHDILTAGGGAVLFTCGKKNAAVLKHLADVAPVTDFLPDMNASMALVQCKNSEKNIQLRKEIHSLFMQSLLRTRHKPFVYSELLHNPVYSFPVLLESGSKEVKQYANRKDVDIEYAFEESIANYLKEENPAFNAATLLLRTVLFPLYPRLGTKNVAKIAKVLGTLP